MTIKSAFQLNKPYKFKDICTIYPVSVSDVIEYDDKTFLDMFIPYLITDEILDDKFKDIPIFEVILSDQNLFKNLIDTLYLICKTKDIKIDIKKKEIYISDNESGINKDNFEEFSSIVREMIQAQKLEKQKDLSATVKPENLERFKKLQESREKYNKAKKKDCQINKIIHMVQFGMGCYINDTEILNMTYWKLIKAYLTITGKSRYENLFDIYLQCGDKKLIEKHWSDMISL